jgi:hypothetical protein
MTRLVLGLLRPYRGWLAVVFVAMLAEIATSLAAPWPPKLVLDDALGKHHLPDWLAWVHDYGFGRHTLPPIPAGSPAPSRLRTSHLAMTMRHRFCAMFRSRSPPGRSSASSDRPVPVTRTRDRNQIDARIEAARPGIAPRLKAFAKAESV